MTMVERVARALAEYQRADANAVNGFDREAARRAIEAMREPSEEMLDVRVVDGTHMDGSTHHVQDLQLNEIWRHMIDAALAEKADA